MKGKSFINSLLENRIIPEEEREVYQFGIECLFLKTVSYLSFLVIAGIMKMPLELFLVAASFIPLRESAGGYHAKTRIGCYLLSCGIVITALLMCKMTTVRDIWYVAEIAADMIIVILAPLDNENKEMDAAEIRYFRKKTMVVLAAVNLACVAAILLKVDILYKTLVIGAGMSAFFLLLEKGKRIFGSFNKGKRGESL